MHELELANDQLRRMRGMNRYYHQRFFSDTRIVAFSILALFLVGFIWAPEAFLLIPVVALLGANQTAFDASYLIFSRQYAARLEDFVNGAMRRRILVASELEENYLFPLGGRKVVTVPIGRPFSWFSWMTILYSLLGLLAAGAAMALGWETLAAAGTGWILFYVLSLGSLTTLSLVLGLWWFVLGAGEERLTTVLDREFARFGRAA